jgi:hypothetical protein
MCIYNFFMFCYFLDLQKMGIALVRKAEIFCSQFALDGRNYPPEK